MLQDEKNIWMAYIFSFLGLILGLVGMHRMYLGFKISGVFMIAITLAGVLSFIYGYFFLVYYPFIEGYVNVLSGGNLSDLPDVSDLGKFNDGSWYYATLAFGGVSLLWLLVDMLMMSSLVRKANDLQD